MKKLLGCITAIIVIACSGSGNSVPNPVGVTPPVPYLIVDTLYRIDTIIKEVERLRVDTIIVSKLDTITKVDTVVKTIRDTVTKIKYDTTYIPTQVYKVDTLFKYDTVTKIDTVFQKWVTIDTLWKKDTLIIHDTTTKVIRDTISAKLVIIKDTLYLRQGDTTRLQFGDSLIIPIKVLKACTVP